MYLPQLQNYLKTNKLHVFPLNKPKFESQKERF